ncbi:MAG: hypothetical protein IJH76_06490 [Clostridia bacterium]|nr:hypothetical protein [Clostridia bacterium]
MYNNLIETYERLIKDANPRELDNTAIFKPSFYQGIIDPKSKLEVDMLYQNYFSIDKEAMTEVLGSLEKELESGNKLNINVIIERVYYCVNKYLGDFKDKEDERDKMYEDKRIVMASELKEKNIAMCVEYSALVHNCLVVVKEATNNENIMPNLVFTMMTKDTGKREGHVCEILIGKNGKGILFDAINPIVLKEVKNPDKKHVELGIYLLAKDELDSFISGNKIIPKSPFEDNNEYYLCYPKSEYGYKTKQKLVTDGGNGPEER